MANNGYSVGRDLTLDIVSNGQVLQLGRLTHFDCKQDVTDKKIKGLDGITDHVRFFEGWSGSFEIERQNGEVDDYFVQLEANYYAGQNERSCTITETKTEADGSISQFRYERVLLKLDDAGKWLGNDTVKMKIGFVASRKVKIV